MLNNPIATLRPHCQTKLCESQGPTPPIGEGGISAGCDQQKQGTLLAFMDSDGGKSTTLNNVGKTMPCLPSPSHHHKYLGGMFTIPGHGWFMTSFYPH